MVNSCSAYGCKNRNSKGSTITFHRFPLNNKSLLKLWLYQIKRGGWEPSKYSVICSEHFKEDCFVTKGLANSRRTLKNDAYPTVFSMAIYSEPPKRTFPGRKSTKDVTMKDEKKDETKDEEMKEEEEEEKEDAKEEDSKDDETKDENNSEEPESNVEED